MAKAEDFKPHSGEPVTLENIEVWYKNFSGEKGQYNEEGERSFNLVIRDSEVADAMLRDGFNIKPLLDEDDNIIGYHMLVRVNYNSGRPPRIYSLAEGREPILYTVNDIGALDSQTILSADVTLGTWIWRPATTLPNISVYCNVMYVMIVDDPLDTKYADWFRKGFDGE